VFGFTGVHVVTALFRQIALGDGESLQPGTAESALGFFFFFIFFFFFFFVFFFSVEPAPL